MRSFDAPPCRDVATSRVTASNSEDPFDRCSVRRVTVRIADGADDPLPHGPTRERRWGSCQAQRIGRIDLVSELIEQLLVVAQQCAGSGEQRGNISFGHLIEQGQNLVPDAVAAKPWVSVGRVDGNGQVEELAQLVRFGAPEGQDRFGWTRTHRAEAFTACTADQAQEQRLGLIVSSVPSEGAEAEHCAASGTGPRLEVGAILEFDAFAAKGHIESFGDGGGDGGIVARVGAKRVIDVNGTDVEIGSDGQRNQRG